MKRAFTLLEILISTILLSIVMLGLYQVLDVQRRSVSHIKNALDESVKNDKVIMTLYNDIYKSDGNLSIQKGERDTLCINSTTNSLYGLDIAKVCWLVLKDKEALTRIEGYKYKLPLGFEDRVEADILAKGVELFDVYQDKKSGNVLVLFKERKKKEPYTFLIQGKTPPPKPPKPKKKKTKTPPKKENNKSKTTPQTTIEK